METTEEVQKTEAGTTIYLKRGLGYALTSISALVAGYTIQSQRIFSHETLPVLVPLALSFSFFVFYAICFDYTKEKDTLHQNEAAWFSIVITLLISVILILAYALRAGSDKAQSILTVNLILSVVIYIGLFISYGWFLRRNFQDTNSPPTRHQLIWPVFLTIGFSLYYGLFFNEFVITLIPFAPIGLLFLYFLAAEIFEFRSRAFTLAGLIVLITTTVLVIVSGLGVFDMLGFTYLSSFLFCFYIAAYLGVFESWRITSHIAKKTYLERQRMEQETSPPLTEGKVSRFHLATFGILVGSTFFIPSIQFVNKYGMIFHAVFVVHALVAIFWWIKYGTNMDQLRQKNWNRRKLFFGFILLGALVIDSRYNFQPDRTLLDDNPPTWITGMIVGAFFFWLGLLLKEIKDEVGTTKISTILFSKSINIIRVLAILSIVTCFVILFFRTYYSKSSTILFKLEFAFVSYLIIIMYCGFLEILNQTGRFPHYFTPTFTSIIGLFTLTRFFTSSFIALIVFLPCIIQGITPFESFLSALPFFLSAASGFSLNDYFDSTKDKINKPHRVIPSKKLSPKAVLITAIILLLMAIISVFIQQINTIQKVIYFSAIIGVIAYNPLVKYFGYSKTLYTAILCSLPIFYDVIVLQYSKVYFLIPLATIIFILGRELLMDAVDIDGDRAGGIKTIPMMLGVTRTCRLSFALMFLGTCALLPLVVHSFLPINILLLSIIFASLIFMSICWKLNSRRFQRIIIILLWFPMLCGMAMLLT